MLDWKKFINFVLGGGMNEFRDHPVAVSEDEQDSNIDAEPIVKHSELKDPEGFTPDQIESASRMFRDADKRESTIKNGVLEDYKSAQQEWDYYKKAKELLIAKNSKSPEQLRAKQKKVIEELGQIDLQITKSDEAREKSKNAWGKLKRLFSSEAPAILSEEKRKEAENKAEELKKQIADLKDRIVETTEAKNFINTHDELKLRNRAEETKLEAEKR